MTMSEMSNSSTVLDDFAKEINEHDDAKRACEVKGMIHTIKIGQLLVEAKKVTPHGKFILWVKQNTRVTQRMAQMYMQIAGDEKIVEMAEREYETVSHLTISKAVELAGKHKREQEVFERCKAAVAKSEETNRDFVRDLGECRDQHFKGQDAQFTTWLIENTDVGKITAERAPELLDREYDREAWLQAMLNDIASDLPEFDGVTADLFVGSAPTP
jgi:spore coat protein CotH